MSCPSRAHADKLQITGVRQGENVLAVAFLLFARD